MFLRVLFALFWAYSMFSFELNVNKISPKTFRAYEYSTLTLEIELKEGTVIASVLPPESEKIIIKPSLNSITSVEGKNKILKFEFTVLPKEKGIFKLKPFKILYYEGEPKEEEPKVYEYNLGEVKVKGKYFYKNLYFWYIFAFFLIFFAIISIIFVRRSYGKGDKSGQG